ncbi:MAG: DUF1176 domain-containing protein [Proteobacteria bacterium]|nr:DUF1176 domain-containing protein [Pseudomonadota bacterium]
MPLARRLAPLATLLFAAAPASAQEPGTYREFRDWMAACDNTRTCRAYALPADPDVPRITLGLLRTGASDAAPQLYLHFTDEELVGRVRRVTIRSEAGVVATLSPGGGLTADDNIFRIADARAAAAILAEARRSRELRLVFEPPLPNVDRAALRISLDGAAAALLWIDDRQMRIGTVTALARRGSAPAAAVPVPVVPAEPQGLPSTGGPAPSELTPATMNAVMAAFRALPGDTCNQEDEERDAPSIDRLGPGQLLVGVRCWRGAYNFSRAYYLVDEGPQPNVRPASFPRPATPAPSQERDVAEADNVLVNADYVGETGSIDHYSKGRGIGDCGELGGWVWDGRAFQPTRLTLMPACRGILPSHWFSLYRTQEGRTP